MIRLTGLPSLAPVAVDAETEAELRRVAARLMGGDAEAFSDAPLPKVEFLRWLADRREVLFHGSGPGDLPVLEPVRFSRDTREFGNQQAVFATDDPIWAIYFAVLRRHAPFGTRNGSMGLVGPGVYPRWYHFSVRRPLDRAARFGPGSLYLVPRASFIPEPAYRGVIETGQWASLGPVRPLVRIDVTPEDFPYLDAVVTHRERDPTLLVYLRFAARSRSLRR